MIAIIMIIIIELKENKQIYTLKHFHLFSLHATKALQYVHV